MSVKTEAMRLGDLLKYELERNYNREVVTILAGAGADRALILGQVLGKITASGKVKEIDFAGADGTENAYGILLYDCTAPNGVDAEGTAVVDGPAIIAKSALVWPAGATANQKATALGQLKAKGIKVLSEA